MLNSHFKGLTKVGYAHIHVVIACTLDKTVFIVKCVLGGFLDVTIFPSIYKELNLSNATWWF